MPKSEPDIGWIPPADWVYGMCRGCDKPFQPKLPKQFWCYDCRVANLSKIMFTPRQKVLEGAIYLMCSRRGYTLTGAARAAKIPKSNIWSWNRSGRPGDYKQVKRLSKVLNCRMDQLFDDSVLLKFHEYRSDYE